MTFRHLHEQILQERQLFTMLSAEISRQRESLDAVIRQIIKDLRNFCLLDTWYPTLTETNVQRFMQSPVYKREDAPIFESPSSLPYSTSVTLRINSFLKQYQTHIQLIMKCANLYFSQNQGQQLLYNPCPTDLSFFACSTFPALFGYCWCVEQTAACVDALLLLLKMQMQECESISSLQFQRSYIRDVIRQFMHMTGIQYYLRKAISHPFLVFVNDLFLAKMDPDSTEYFIALCKYAYQMTEGLIDAIQYMPSAVRYFLKKAYDISPSTLEYLFFDLIFQPAMVNPKLFAIIPENAIAPRSNHLTLLTKLFRWSLNPQSITEKMQTLTTLNEFKQIRVAELMSRLSNYSGELDGVFSAKIQKVSEMRYHLLLLSVNDVVFLMHIINSTIDKIDHDTASKDRLKNLCKIDDILSLKNPNLIDFWFTAYKLPNQPFKPIEEPNIFALPIFPQDCEPQPKDDLESVVNHLITYISSCTIDDEAPNDLIPFLEYWKQKCSEYALSDSLTRTHSILTAVKRHRHEVPEILNRAQISIERRLLSHKGRMTQLFSHQICTNDLEHIRVFSSQLNDQLAAIIHQAILRLFLIKNKDIEDRIPTIQLLLMCRVSDWMDYFMPLQEEFLQFTNDLGLPATQNMRITRQLHSIMLNLMPFSLFLQANLGYKETDAALCKACDEVLPGFLQEEYSKFLHSLFNQPDTFDPAIDLIRDGTQFGGPIERLEQIEICMNLLQDIYLFEAGEGCPGDDFLPMFAYVLLRAKLPNLYSLMRYIQHFLLSVDEKVKLLSPKEKYVATTFSTAAQYVMNLTHIKEPEQNK